MPLPNDAVAPTGYSPFSRDNVDDAKVYAFLTYTQGGQKVSIERRISKLIRKPQMAAIKAVMRALNGAAAGAAALATKPLIDAQNTSPGVPTIAGTDLGGVRNVSTFNYINRNTVASDQTYVDSLLNVRHGPALASYPVDLSGNGGGGKLG